MTKIINWEFALKTNWRGFGKSGKDKNFYAFCFCFCVLVQSPPKTYYDSYFYHKSDPDFNQSNKSCHVKSGTEKHLKGNMLSKMIDIVELQAISLITALGDNHNLPLSD